MKTKDIILFSPYDNKFDNSFVTDFEFNENSFVNYFFELIEEFKNLKNNFDLTFNKQTNYSTQISILSGYSGCGKTTFINYYKRTIHEENKNYFFKIINLVKKAKGINDDENLIVSALIDDLINNLLELQCFSFIAEHSYIFIEHFNKSSVADIKNINIDFQDSGKTKNEKIETLHSFLKNIDFKEILILYFLSFILKFKDENKDNYIFCLDNLDELNIEYLSVKIWTDILDVLDILRGFCKMSELSLNFDIDNKISILFIMREANISISNAQFDDRLNTSITKRRIILSGSAQKILNKRFDFIEGNKKLFLNLEDDTLYELMKIFSKEEEFIQRTILPFLNFDYRRLFQILLFMTNPNNPDSQNCLQNITFNEYYKIQQKRKNLSRGILYNGLILHAIKNNFYNFIDEKSGCRPSRLILTVIYNLSYPKGLPFDTEKRNFKEPKRINLLDFIEKTESKFSIEKIIENFNNYFNTSQSSWAHFITVYNMRIKNNSLDFSDELKKILRKANAKNIISPFETKALSDIEIQLNASGYVYLRYIITHFEYFSILAIKYGKIEIDKHNPLVKMLGYDVRISKYEFEIIINEVFNIVSKYETSIRVDFYKKYNKYDENTYLNDDCVFSFKGEETNPKSFYISRVITTHITYLDDFRYFLYHDEEFNNNLSTNSLENQLPNKKNKKEINRYIVQRIKAYVKLAEEGINDKSIKNSIFNIKRNIQLVEIDNFNNWVNIAQTE